MSKQSFFQFMIWNSFEFKSSGFCLSLWTDVFSASGLNKPINKEKMFEQT